MLQNSHSGASDGGRGNGRGGRGGRGRGSGRGGGRDGSKRASSTAGLSALAWGRPGHPITAACSSRDKPRATDRRKKEEGLDDTMKEAESL